MTFQEEFKLINQVNFIESLRVIILKFTKKIINVGGNFYLVCIRMTHDWFDFILNWQYQRNQRHIFLNIFLKKNNGFNWQQTTSA